MKFEIFAILRYLSQLSHFTLLSPFININFLCTQTLFSIKTKFIDGHGVYDVLITIEPGNLLLLNYVAFEMYQCRVDNPSTIASLYSKSFLVSFKGFTHFFILCKNENNFMALKKFTRKKFFIHLL